MNYILGISVEELREMFSKHKLLILVDVSLIENRETGLFSKTLHLPWNRIGEKAEEVLKEKDTQIVIFSSTPGDGSTVAATIELDAMGYENIRFYKGDLIKLADLVNKYDSGLKTLEIVAA